MYLANDVIQNSKKKGPEYGEAFRPILSKAFKDIAQRCEDEKTFSSLGRILKIWGERGVYEGDKIKEYEDNLNSGHPKKKSSETSSSKNKEESSRKRKAEESTASASNGSDKKKAKTPVAKVPPPTTTPSKPKILEVNGETHVTLSPTTQPVGDPPEPDELVRMLEGLEEAASSDAATREKITRLPPEVSSVEALAKISDKDAAGRLQRQVNEAVQLLKDYNSRLAAEMTDRNKLAVMLKDFQREQQELLTQAEQRLQVRLVFFVFTFQANDSFGLFSFFRNTHRNWKR
jgi:regulator of Ty1 transposition protein 103